MNLDPRGFQVVRIGLQMMRDVLFKRALGTAAPESGAEASNRNLWTGACAGRLWHQMFRLGIADSRRVLAAVSGRRLARQKAALRIEHELQTE